MNSQLKSGLRYLVIFHRFTCNSYFGWNFGQKLKKKTKFILIAMNILLFVLCACYNYYSIDFSFNLIDKKDKFSDSASKSLLLFILLMTTTFGFSIEVISILFINLIIGKSILTFLWEQNIKIDSSVEKKMGIKLVILQILLSLIIELPFPFFVISIYNFSYFQFFKTYLFNVLNQNIRMSFFSLMAYQSFYFEQKFTEITDSFTSLTQLKWISNQVFKMAELVKRYDKFFNKYLFIAIMLNTFSAICTSTIIYFDRGRLMPFTIPALMESLVIIYLVCFISAKLSKSYAKLLDKFELLEVENSEHGDIKIDNSLVMRLYGLRCNLCYTAFHIYPINTKTFMSIISTIVTFSVILIQTT